MYCYLSGSEICFSIRLLLLLIDLYELLVLIFILGEIILNEISPFGDLFNFEAIGGLGELFPTYNPFVGVNCYTFYKFSCTVLCF